MPEVIHTENQFLRVAPDIHASEPLWKRAPARDQYGHALSDFMMLIPGLNKHPHARIQTTLREINSVLMGYQKAVVFADFNLKINILWITVRPIPGICLEVATAINLRVPEAKLVAHKHE